MTLDFFTDAVARAIEESGRSGYPPDREMQEYANLPNDWALRINNQGNGITAAIQSDGVLLVQSPDNRWQLYLIVPPQTPSASK